MEQTVPEQNDALKLAEEASKKKIEKLISTKDRLDAYDLRTSLSEEEMRVYKQKLYTRLTQLELEHDIMTRKLSDVTEGVPLNEMQREHNQRKIQLAIHRLLNKNGTMPSKTQLAEYTGLSRQTIHNHMQENISTGSDLAHEYAIMAPQVMNKVLQNALNGEGNMRAAKMYLDVAGTIMNAQTKPSYLNVNGSFITQADMDRLSEEQKKKVLEAMKQG